MDSANAVHPADPILHAYGLGKLDDASSLSVRQHLEACEPCRQRLAELSSGDVVDRLGQGQNRLDQSATGWTPREQSVAGGSEGAGGPPPPSADAMPPESGDQPDFEIIRELGRGAKGLVYLAWNRPNRRYEVLRTVGPPLSELPGVLGRFLDGIRAAAKLDHPNIVTAYSAMRLGESLVFAMEYVEGLDLARMVKAEGPLPVAHACSFIYQAALGLQHAHERGVVHGNIKPANLIVTRRENKSIVKVLDFGTAKLVGEDQMPGTAEFIAPEQIRDAQSADVRTDIYCLGCTLYTLLAGKPPVRGDSIWDQFKAHFSMDATPLNLVRPEVPVELAATVAKMMAKKPGRRFQAPGQVAQVLLPFFKIR